MTYTEARQAARMTNKEVARYLELSYQTTKRYQEKNKAPKAIIECLLMIGGKCPNWSLRNDFSNWSFGGGYIYSPAGDRFTSGDILATIYDKQIIRDQRTEIKALKNKIGKNVPDNIIQFPINPYKKDLLA